MKTETMSAVKNNLSRVLEELPGTGAVVITKNGRVRAVLLPVSDDTDLETLVLSSNSRFWELFEQSAKSRKWTPLDAVP